MGTQFRTTKIERDPMYNLERELKIRGFSRKTIKAYLHYKQKFLNFARNCQGFLKSIESFCSLIWRFANLKSLPCFEKTKADFFLPPLAKGNASGILAWNPDQGG